MKYVRSLLMALMVLAIFSGTTHSVQLTPGIKAGFKLLEMASKGWIELQIGEPNTIILVEPKVWSTMTHQQKYQLTKWGLDYCKEKNQRDKKNIVHVFLWDMTSHNQLAMGYVMGTLANRIDVLK